MSDEKNNLIDETIEYRDFNQFMNIAPDSVYRPYVPDGLPPSEGKKIIKKMKERQRLGYEKCKSFLLKYGEEAPSDLVVILSDTENRKYCLTNKEVHHIPGTGYSILVWYKEYTDGKIIKEEEDNA